jgi:hypothetical protein
MVRPPDSQPILILPDIHMQGFGGLGVASAEMFEAGQRLV